MSRQKFFSKGSIGYGRGEHFIELGDELLYDQQRLAGVLLDRFKSPAYRPPVLPTVALKLVEMTRNLDINLDAVVRLLNQDPMLAGQVLRLVQSPVYAGSSPINGLRGAVVRIGLKNVRDVVIEAALSMRVFRCPGYAEPMDRLRKHSGAVAHMSRMICRYTSFDSEYAFLCGLLHDVGIAGTLLALGDVPRNQNVPDLSLIWPAVDDVHAEASETLCRLWKLSPDIQLVVRHHHIVTVQGFPHPLAATVCLAESLATELNVGLGGPVDRTPEIVVKRAVEALNLSRKAMQLIREKAEEIVLELSSS